MKNYEKTYVNTYIDKQKVWIHENFEIPNSPPLS